MLEINRYVQRPGVTFQGQKARFRRIWSLLMDTEETQNIKLMNFTTVVLKIVCFL